ncbi:MAG: acetyl-CoA carboxylase carboxyltransferase subunit beta [Phycisphaerae bacterium]|nr:acetyl-CoA carboxylase carboxyltransferase subunit beta [Phycisphaerae bacterium]
MNASSQTSGPSAAESAPPPVATAADLSAEANASASVETETKKGVPEGLWIKCPGCAEMEFKKRVEQNLMVCPRCQHHMRVSAARRIEQLLDPGSFDRFNADMAPADPLGFIDTKPYLDRIRDTQKKTGENDAMQTGYGFVKGRRVVLACMDFTFFGGSMGSVVGEKITQAIERAMEKNLPLIIVSCSGGARMQESGYSLMQMAKTSAALARFHEAGGLYISVLADPTTGGVTASFAMLGDVIFAEPKALIGFAGPRVIAQTIRQELPDGFQTSEFLLESGFVDRIVHRKDLRSEISRVIDYANK